MKTASVGTRIVRERSFFTPRGGTEKIFPDVAQKNFRTRHSNIFKIGPTNLYGYTRRNRETGGVTPPPPIVSPLPDVEVLLVILNPYPSTVFLCFCRYPTWLLTASFTSISNCFGVFHMTCHTGGQNVLLSLSKCINTVRIVYIFK